jgi:hypothetical protein
MTQKETDNPILGMVTWWVSPLIAFAVQRIGVRQKPGVTAREADDHPAVYPPVE